MVWFWGENHSTSGAGLKKVINSSLFRSWSCRTLLIVSNRTCNVILQCWLWRVYAANMVHYILTLHKWLLTIQKTSILGLPSLQSELCHFSWTPTWDPFCLALIIHLTIKKTKICQYLQDTPSKHNCNLSRWMVIILKSKCKRIKNKHNSKEYLKKREWLAEYNKHIFYYN